MKISSVDDYDMFQRPLNSSSSASKLRKKESVFSLTSRRSVRLQRFGSWIAFEDQKTQKLFWYNHSKAEGVWEKPDEVIALEKAAIEGTSSGDNFYPANHTSAGSSSTKLRRNGEWIEYITEFGHMFYYNDVTGKFQWDDPNRVEGAVTDGDAHHSDDNAINPHQDSPWRAYKDPETAGVFWFNSETNISQWECPFPGEGTLFQGFALGEEIEDAFVVHDNDDLGI